LQYIRIKAYSESSSKPIEFSIITVPGDLFEEIGKSLMASPALLLLDEPAAGVNPNLGRRIFERIEDLRQNRGLSFFIIEHRLEILFDFAHWVYVMDKGKIVVEGKPEEVAKNPAFYQVYLGD
jgi:branched-chain amino acid transport system ATP-binding protein